MNASRRINLARRVVLGSVAVLIGCASVARSVEYLSVVRDRGASLSVASWQANAAVLGPGVFGVALLIGLALLAFRHPVGEVAYWGAMLIGASLLLLATQGFLGIIELDAQRKLLQFTSPGLEDGSLWNLREAAAVGCLTLFGLWIAEPEYPALEGGALPHGSASALRMNAS